MTRKWKELEEGFSSVSTRYDEIYYEKGLKQRLMERRLNEILGEVNPKNDEKILEIGPGSGAYTLSLLEKGAEVTAIDISEDMIEVCKKKVEDKGFKAEFHQGNILNIPIQDETRDKAIAIGIMTHLPEKKMFVEAVKEMLRTLRGGGLFGLTCQDTIQSRYFTARRILSSNPFQKNRKGFKVIYSRIKRYKALRRGIEIFPLRKSGMASITW